MKRFLRFLWCTGVAFLTAIVVCAVMVVCLAQEYSADVLDNALIVALFTLISIIPFFTLEGTRLSKFWRHLFFLLPWIFYAAIVILVALQLPFENTGDGLSMGLTMLFTKLGFLAFKVYSAGFWASYICCVLLSYFRPDYAADPPSLVIFREEDRLVD